MTACKRYGHNTMYALRGSGGFLCYTWWASVQQAVVLFSDTKTANAWVKSANKVGELIAAPFPVTTFPDGYRPTINPSSDASDIQRVLVKMFWHNW